MIHKALLGIVLGVFIFFATQVAKADIIYTSTLSTGTVIVYNLDTGETDFVMGDGATPVVIVGGDSSDE